MRGVQDLLGGFNAVALRALAALLLSLSMPATAALTGSPPLSRFTPDIEVYPQNFDVVQDASAVIYVANSDGVLSFDGERWQLIPLTNNDLARSLAFDGTARIYVGGYDDFGYIERDASGVERFNDLAPLFKALLKGERYADIWDVHVAPEGVFFKAVRHLFLYRPESGTVQMWRHEGRFGAIVQYRGDTVVQFRGAGLKRLRKGAWEMIPGGENLQEQVFKLLPLPGDGLLTLARDGHWHEFRDGRVSDRAMPPGMPESSFFADGLVLPDSTLALASDDGSLYFYDPREQRSQKFRLDADSLSGIWLARDGGLITADDLSVYHVSWPSSWSVLGASDGLTGAVHGIAHLGERWFALGGAGIYEADASATGARFRRLDWTNHEAWDLLDLGDGDALLAESYAVKLVRNGKARAITGGAFYPRLFVRSKFDPDLVYVATEIGLATFQRVGREWKLLNEPDEAHSFRINSLVEISPTELWAGTERDGVQRLTLSEQNHRIVKSQSYGSAEGIAYGRVAGAWVRKMPDGALVASTSGGLFRWQEGRFGRTDLDGLGALRDPEEWLLIESAPNGDTWAYSYNHVYHRDERTVDATWKREEIASFRRGGIEALAFEPGGAVLFGASSQVLRYDPANSGFHGRAPELALRAVERVDSSGQRETLPLHAAPPRILEGDFRLAFRVALPEYRRPEAARYQGRLIGVEDAPSEWSDATSYSYAHLAPGEYRFEARARDALGEQSATQSWPFTVAPHWYNTIWARAALALGVVLALGGVIGGGISVSTRLLHADKQRLERIVAERTRELKSANRQLEAMAHLDGLTEVPNRRRLDDYLEESWALCARLEQPLAILAVDVDSFKPYNDRHGHLAGDDMLKKVVRVLSHNLRRPEDLVARFGGDEFLVVLPGLDLAAARERAEKMRAEVEEAELGPTISIGVAARQPRPGEAVSVIVGEADAALYQAKHSGRNRVAIARA